MVEHYTRSVKSEDSLSLYQSLLKRWLEFYNGPSGQPMSSALSPEERFSVWVRLHLSEQFQTPVVELLGDHVERV
jgi:hypothetical protein